MGKKIHLRNKEKFDQVYAILQEKYEANPDPWGLDLKKSRFYFELLYPLYKYYFRTRIFGAHKVQDKPYIMVANHSGQIATDGMLIVMSFLLDITPPRILRGMVERFLPKLPFIGEMVAHTGSILGDRENCLYLLDKGESILTFPEGMKGIAKSTTDFYKLQKFSSGFFRMALQKKVDILPIAVVGAEETYPFIYQAKSFAKLLRLPMFPISPTGYVPLPAPIDIYIGDPYKIPDNISHDSREKEIRNHILDIKSQIGNMINEGLKNKRSII